MKKPAYQIPFNKDGSQLSYYGFDFHEWRDNFEFEDTLEYVAYSKGRSSVGFEFKRTDGTMVSMFLTDLDSALPLMVGGKITGRFTFTKRGENYGCKRIGEAPMNITDTDRIDHLARRGSINSDLETYTVRFDVPEAFDGGDLREIIDAAIDGVSDA